MKYVVLYWVGSPNHPNSSIRSTGGYSRFEGVGEGRRGTLSELQDDLDKQGYQTQIVNVYSAVSILEKYAPPNPKIHKAPRKEMVEKRKRKPTRHTPYVSFEA